MSSEWKHCGDEGERGMPKTCRCGEASLIRTSKTYENPGRLFHCCPNGSKKEKNHLLKWTDEAVVEEIDDIKDSYGQKIKEMNDVIVEFEKEIEEMKTTVYGCDKEFKDFVVEHFMCNLPGIKEATNKLSLSEGINMGLIGPIV
ncbi:uncharacterized protein At4g04775-like [Brassica rapa]|uniref:uncharacterized protein At4g04775-like n=1 Tax=Brassica campestris TaxID=3711 RepID=UPI00142E183D|nr:uncharacterized protein At4g04775-like [Brassica rapa]